jgi:DNA polymerase
VTIGTSRVVLYPLYHPAAALYTPSMLEVLEQDFARLPALLAGGEPEPPRGTEPAPLVAAEPETVQLGLF